MRFSSGSVGFYLARIGRIINFAITFYPNVNLSEIRKLFGYRCNCRVIACDQYKEYNKNEFHPLSPFNFKLTIKLCVSCLLSGSTYKMPFVSD